MAKGKKKDFKEEVKKVEQPKVIKSVDTPEQAKKFAQAYILKDEDRYETIIKDNKEVKADKCDIMFVTSDKNVFFKQHEGSARAHARRNGLKVFEVKN